MTRACVAVLLLPAVLLGACGELPRPFAHDGAAAPNELLTLPDHAGVVVGPVQGVDPATSLALTEALAEALRRANVIASSRGGNAGSFALESWVESDGTRRMLFAELLQPSGALVARQSVPLPAGGADSERNWRTVADATARPLASVLAGEPAEAMATVAPAAGDPIDAPPLAIAAVSGGTPEADGHVLERALSYSLQQRNIKTVDKPAANLHQIRGALKVTARPNNQRNLAVVWTVIGPDGTELGKVEQANDVPLPLLKSAWSDIALAVAEGAAEGIINVLEERGILR